MLVGERGSMSKQTCSSEQERNLITYSMPHHGVLLVYFFPHGYYYVTWCNIMPHHIIFYDVAKYSLTTLKYFATSHPWFVLR